MLLAITYLIFISPVRVDHRFGLPCAIDIALIAGAETAIGWTLLWFSSVQQFFSYHLLVSNVTYAADLLTLQIRPQHLVRRLTNISTSLA